MTRTFDDCLRDAKRIVEIHRAPGGFDPKCWYVSTTLIAIALVSAAVSATGAIMSAQAQSDSAKYNAAVANNNAAMARQQGEFDAQQIRDKNRRVLAQQRNVFAANGVATDTGVATDVAADSAQQGEMQALMAIYTGRSSATAQEAQRKLYNMQAGNAMTAGYMSAGASLLGGASSAAAMDAGSKNPTFMK